MKHCPRVALAIVVLVGCAQPADLTFTLTVREPSVSAVEVVIDTPNRPGALDCRFNNDGTRSLGCALEDSHANWTGLADPISFILYGSPDSRATINAKGFDASGVVVSSTVVEVSLPSRNGGTTTATAALRAITEVHKNCAIDLTDANLGSTQTSLSVFDRDKNGKLVILALSAGRASLVSYEPSSNGCQLSVLTEQAVDKTGHRCTVVPGTVLLGNVDASPEPEVVLQCNVVTTGQNTVPELIAARAANPDLANSSARLTGLPELVAPGNPNPVLLSPPVLVDLDGSGIAGVAFLAWARTATTQLWIWRPGGAPATSVFYLPGFHPERYSEVNPPPIAPLAVPTGNGHQERLLIEGYVGGRARYDSQAGLVISRPRRNSNQTDWGPSAVMLDAAPVLGFRFRLLTSSMELVFLDESTQSTFQALSSARVPTTARGTHLAIGDLRGDGKKTAVMGSAQDLFLFPIDPTIMGTATATAAHLTLSSVDPLSGALTILLANFDHHPGAEIIAFNPNANLVFALDADGKAPIGWPISPGKGTAPLRAMVADLDGDGSLELITLSYTRLEVFSLGPGTYDHAATPWPVASGDQLGRATNLSEADPLR